MKRYRVIVYTAEGSRKTYKGITQRDKELIVKSILCTGYTCSFRLKGRETYRGPGNAIAFERSSASYVDEILSGLGI